MDTTDDGRFDRTLNQLYQEQPAAIPEFDTMWLDAQATVRTRTMRRRRTRLGLLAAIGLLAFVTVRPWADRGKTASEPAVASIDFARLHQMVEDAFPTPQWTDPSPTQYLVELSPRPRSVTYQLVN